MVVADRDAMAEAVRLVVAVETPKATRPQGKMGIDYSF
jgi:hypothetical protein